MFLTDSKTGTSWAVEHHDAGEDWTNREAL